MESSQAQPQNQGQGVSWKTSAGGLGGLAARYGAENSVQRKIEEDESLYDMDGGLPMDHVPLASLDTSNLDQSSVNEYVPSSNIGYKMLLKLGWKGEASGLGKKEQGRVEPVPLMPKGDFLGLGKAEEYEEKAVEATKQRRALESEIEETTDVLLRRIEQSEKKEKIEQNVQEIVRPFYCQLCNKQYKTTVEFEVHLSSYDHNHKKRFSDMQRMTNAQNVGRNKQKQERREERQLQAMMEAAAAAKKNRASPVENPTPSPASQSAASAAPAVPAAEAKPQAQERKPVAFSMGGRKPVAFSMKPRK